MTRTFDVTPPDQRRTKRGTIWPRRVVDGALAGALGRPYAASWSAPHCGHIFGTASVTYTHDDGVTLTPAHDDLGGTTYTRGAVPLDRPDTLLAVQDRTLLRTTDSGCHWSRIGVIPTVSDGAPVSLFAAPGGRAYGWSDGRPDLVRIEADPADGKHLRIGGGDLSRHCGSVPGSHAPNGALLAAHPSDRNVVYFVFGSSFQNYGTDLFRYDGETGLIGQSHNPYDGIGSIAFNPADPGVLYLGLVSESIF